MTENEIIKAINSINNFHGMTVNERLYITGLMSEFDEAKIQNKPKAKKILELLNVDKISIYKILS